MGGDRQSTWEHMAQTNNKPCAQHTETFGGQPGHTSRTVTTSMQARTYIVYPVGCEKNKKPWFLSKGPMLGASCRRKMLMTDASLTGWGVNLEGRSSQGLWKDHNLSWLINHLEMLAVFLVLKNFQADLRGPPCARPLRQHIGGLLHKSLGGFAVMSTLQTCVPNPSVVPREVVFFSNSLHPGVPQYMARHPVETGAEARGMEVVELIWREFGQAQVYLFASRETSHCPLWFSLMHPAHLGLDAMMHTWPRFRLYAFPPIALLL